MIIISKNNLTKKDGPMVQLNTALAWDGLYVNVPKNIIVDKPIQVLYFSTGSSPIFNQTRSLILLDDGASAEIIERHHSPSQTETWTNAVDEVKIGCNAKIHWVKLQHDSEKSALTQHSKINQEKDSRAIVHTISTGGKFLRNNLDFLLNINDYAKLKLEVRNLQSLNLSSDSDLKILFKGNVNTQIEGKFLNYNLLKVI